MTRSKYINWWNTEIGARELVQIQKAVDNKKFTQGSISKDLELLLGQFLKTDHVVLVNSGTSALMVALLASGIRPKDEVIVPDFTWVATAQAAHLLGAKVLCVDSLSDSPCLDTSKIEPLITKKTKAIIPVHFHGRACNMEKIMGLSEYYKITVVEDACKAIACYYAGKNLGKFGRFGCFSMGMISMFSIGYGGFLIAQNEEDAESARKIRDHGVQREPTEVLALSGGNFKVSDILASIGISQVKRFTEKKEHLLSIYELYRERLKNCANVNLLTLDVENGEFPLCIDLMCEDRIGLTSFMHERGFGCSALHQPMHSAPYLKIEGKFPNSKKFSSQGFMPPCGPSQPLSAVNSAIDCIIEWDELKTKGCTN